MWRDYVDLSVKSVDLEAMTTITALIHPSDTNAYRQLISYLQALLAKSSTLSGH